MLGAIREQKRKGRLTWLPDSEGLGIVKTEGLHVLLEEGSSIGVELHFGLLEQTVVNTLVEEDTSKEELIFGNS